MKCFDPGITKRITDLTIPVDKAPSVHPAQAVHSHGS